MLLETVQSATTAAVVLMASVVRFSTMRSSVMPVAMRPTEAMRPTVAMRTAAVWPFMLRPALLWEVAMLGAMLSWSVSVPWVVSVARPARCE